MKEWGYESVNRSLTLINQLLPWKEERNKNSSLDKSDKLIDSSQHYIGTQSDLTQVMTLKKKIWSSASELKQTKIEQFRMWIVNSDRQFCRTVYVISWTVALILSTRKIVNLEHVFVSFQDCVGKTRNFSVWSLSRFGREEEYTLHRKFGHKWNWILKILFIDELLVISENRTLHFSNSDLFVDGRKKENRASKLRINWIVSRSVIYLSGSTQGSEFWADLLKSVIVIGYFRFLWWIVIITGIN